MRTFTTGDITAKLSGTITAASTGDIYYCRRSNLVAYISTAANSVVVVESGDPFGMDYLYLTYLTDDNGNLQIDLTDWARTKPIYQSVADRVEFTITHGQNVITVGMQTLEGLCPEEIIMPPAHVITAAPSHVIMPPDVIYTALRFADFDIPISFPLLGYNSAAAQRYVEYMDGEGEIHTVSVPAWNVRAQCVEVAANAVWLTYPLVFGRHRIEPQPLDYKCDDCCMLIWQGIEGVEKRHIFRVRNRKYAADERTNFLTYGAGYDSRANMVMSFEAFIEGCNRYDYAYYSDIVCSPYVRCLYTWGDLYADEAGIEQMSGVEVTTKNLTVPNSDGAANKTNTFVVEINYRHYGKL